MPVDCSKLNLDFSNLSFVSCPKFSKTYSPSVFFINGLKLYVFESVNENINFNLKNKIGNA